MDWDIYERMLERKGSSKRERAIETFRSIADKKYTGHPSCKKVLINDKERDLLIFKTDKFDENIFYTMPNETIQLGDMVFWNGEVWVVSNLDYDEEIYTKGTILKCNHLLKWQDFETGIIQEMWCVFTKPYSTGVNEQNVITTPDAKYKLGIRYTEYTKKFFIDKRLAIGTIYRKNNNSLAKILDVYSIIDFNPITQTVGEYGFVEVVLKKDLYNEDTDSLELEICDYVKIPPIDNDNNNDSNEDNKNYYSLIAGKPTIKNSGVSYFYDAKFYNSNGEEDDNIVAVWTIDEDESLLSKIKISTIGNRISISCTDDSLVGETIKLCLLDTLDIYEMVFININIVSIFN